MKKLIKVCSVVSIMFVLGGCRTKVVDKPTKNETPKIEKTNVKSTVTKEGARDLRLCESIRIKLNMKHLEVNCLEYKNNSGYIMYSISGNDMASNDIDLVKNVILDTDKIHDRIELAVIKTDDSCVFDELIRQY